jgi:hypothetical protein
LDEFGSLNQLSVLLLQKLLSHQPIHLLIYSSKYLTLIEFSECGFTNDFRVKLAQDENGHKVALKIMKREKEGSSSKLQDIFMNEVN